MIHEVLQRLGVAHSVIIRQSDSKSIRYPFYAHDAWPRSSERLHLASLSLSPSGVAETLQSMTAQKLADGTVHELPSDFQKAIESNRTVNNLWADFTPLARNEWICWIISAKQDATRKRRIEVGMDKMQKGMRRPCCWPGCPHR